MSIVDGLTITDIHRRSVTIVICIILPMARMTYLEYVMPAIGSSTDVWTNSA